MPLTNRFLGALFTAFLSIDYATATYMIHSSCDKHPIVGHAIKAAQILARDANSRLSTRPWNMHDQTEREYAQYASWLFGEDGTAEQQNQPSAMPPIPEGPRLVDRRSFLDKFRDSMGNIAIVLSNSSPFPSQPTVVVPAEGERPALTNFSPLIPTNTEIFYCDLARMGPPITPDPTRPHQGYQLDSDFLIDTTFTHEGDQACALGMQAYNACRPRFCITQICPEYLKLIEDKYMSRQGQGFYQIPEIDGPLQLDEIEPGEAAIDFYVALAGVILHEMTHTHFGGDTLDDFGVGWLEVRSAGTWGIRNADNYLLWAVAAKLADEKKLYTHWGGDIDTTPHPMPI